MRRWLMRRRRTNAEIAPEDILLDAEVKDSFAHSRFEGRIERPLTRGAYLTLAGGLALGLLILLVRAGDLELLQGHALAARSAANSLDQTELFAPRGLITDRRGVVLADNAEEPDGTLRRRYPYPELGTIIGYVSYPKTDSAGNYYETEEHGVAGLEATYDDLLSGENGTVLIETDATGKVRSQGTTEPAQPGKTLVTTLDADLERHLAAAVSKTAERAGFIAGAAVILDTETGAVRAIVSYPSYDPAVMSEGAPAADIAAYNTDPGHPFLDHAISGIYTPGSIVKPFVAAGGLTDGIITPTTVINDTALLTIPDPYHPGQSFSFTGWRALGPVDVRKAIAWSSDVFFYTVGGGFKSTKGLGIDRLDYWYRVFGMGEPTGIELAGEAAGIIPSPAWKERVLEEPWYLGDTYHTAIGQYSMQVTPIQMARATASLVNGGRLLTPTLIAGEPVTASTVPVSEEVFKVVREGMRRGVTEALASAINFPYVAVAAKTGTAQVGEHNQFDNSWVEGFYPYDNPRYAFAVVLERGPAGAGEEAVNVMRDFFTSLHADGIALQ